MKIAIDLPDELYKDIKQDFAAQLIAESLLGELSPSTKVIRFVLQAIKQSAEPTAEHAPELNMTTLLKEFKEIEKRADKMEAALEAISAWGDAYPLTVFPEPDFKIVRELLEAGGISLDAVSASNMRHVVEGVAKIAREGLGED